MMSAFVFRISGRSRCRIHHPFKDRELFRKRIRLIFEDEDRWRSFKISEDKNYEDRWRTLKGRKLIDSKKWIYLEVASSKSSNTLLVFWKSVSMIQARANLVILFRMIELLLTYVEIIDDHGLNVLVEIYVTSGKAEEVNIQTENYFNFWLFVKWSESFILI